MKVLSLSVLLSLLSAQAPTQVEGQTAQPLWFACATFAALAVEPEHGSGGPTQIGDLLFSVVLRNFSDFPSCTASSWEPSLRSVALNRAFSRCAVPPISLRSLCFTEWPVTGHLPTQGSCPRGQEACAQTAPVHCFFRAPGPNDSTSCLAGLTHLCASASESLGSSIWLGAGARGFPSQPKCQQPMALTNAFSPSLASLPLLRSLCSSSWPKATHQPQPGASAMGVSSVRPSLSRLGKHGLMSTPSCGIKLRLTRLPEIVSFSCVGLRSGRSGGFAFTRACFRLRTSLCRTHQVLALKAAVSYHLSFWYSWSTGPLRDRRRSPTCSWDCAVLTFLPALRVLFCVTPSSIRFGVSAILYGHSPRRQARMARSLRLLERAGCSTLCLALLRADVDRLLRQQQDFTSNDTGATGWRTACVTVGDSRRARGSSRVFRVTPVKRTLTACFTGDHPPTRPPP